MKITAHFSGLLIAAVLAVTALLMLQLSNLLYPSEIYSYYALSIFVMFAISIAKFSPISFVLLLNYIFLRVTMFISGIFIENGAYMLEIATLGEPTGAMIRYAIICVIFTSFCAIIIEYFMQKLLRKAPSNLEIPISKFVVLILYTLLITSSIYMIFIGSTEGFPLFTGVDRLIYRTNIDSRFYLAFMTNRTIFAVLLGLIVARSNGLRKYSAIILFILLLILSFLFSEKFASITQMIIFFVLPLFLLSVKLRSKILVAIVPIIIIISIITIPAVLYIYGWNKDSEQAMQRFSSRVSGQAQVWYLADRDTYEIVKLDGNHLLHNAKSFVSINPDKASMTAPYLGVRYFMFKYMKRDRLLHYLKVPITLTMAFEAYMLAMFGWLGMILPLIICAVFMSVSFVYLGYAIINSRIMSIIIASKIMLWISFGILQGDLWFIFGYKTIICSMLACAYEIFTFRKNNRHGYEKN